MADLRGTLTVAQSQVTVRLESEASIDASAPRSAGFTAQAVLPYGVGVAAADLEGEMGFRTRLDLDGELDVRAVA